MNKPIKENKTRGNIKPLRQAAKTKKPPAPRGKDEHKAV